MKKKTEKCCWFNLSRKNRKKKYEKYKHKKIYNASFTMLVKNFEITACYLRKWMTFINNNTKII